MHNPPASLSFPPLALLAITRCQGHQSPAVPIIPLPPSAPLLSYLHLREAQTALVPGQGYSFLSAAQTIVCLPSLSPTFSTVVPSVGEEQRPKPFFIASSPRIFPKVSFPESHILVLPHGSFLNFCFSSVRRVCPCSYLSNFPLRPHCQPYVRPPPLTVTLLLLLLQRPLVDFCLFRSMCVTVGLHSNLPLKGLPHPS